MLLLCVFVWAALRARAGVGSKGAGPPGRALGARRRGAVILQIQRYAAAAGAMRWRVREAL